jgi:hypothetical protein
MAILKLTVRAHVSEIPASSQRKSPVSLTFPGYMANYARNPLIQLPEETLIKCLSQPSLRPRGAAGAGSNLKLYNIRQLIDCFVLLSATLRSRLQSSQ